MHKRLGVLSVPVRLNKTIALSVHHVPWYWHFPERLILPPKAKQKQLQLEECLRSVSLVWENTRKDASNLCSTKILPRLAVIKSAAILCTNSEWFDLHYIILDHFCGPLKLCHQLRTSSPQQAFEAEIRMQRTALQRQALALKEVSHWSEYMKQTLTCKQMHPRSLKGWARTRGNAPRLASDWLKQTARA